MTQHSHHSPYPTLPTQFLLLHGPRQACHDFADDLASRLEPGSSINMDFASPLIDATAGLFYSGNTLEINFDDPDNLLKHIPDTNTSLDEWLKLFRGQIRFAFGPDILGRILARYYRENLYDLCPTIFARDLDNVADIRPLLDAGHTACVINLGPLHFAIPPHTPHVPYFWVPNPKVPEATDYFLHEISNVRPTTTRATATPAPDPDQLRFRL